MFSMDCMTFNKCINAYLKCELTDKELNDFLVHFGSCGDCREELEINYIMTKGIEVMDDPKGNYNLIQSFNADIDESRIFIKLKKRLLRLRYIMNTLFFWALVFSVFFFIRGLIF